jgi:hypothetical protein
VDTLDTDSSAFTKPWSTIGNTLPNIIGWSASHSAREPRQREKGWYIKERDRWRKTGKEIVGKRGMARTNRKVAKKSIIQLD